jgi:hypothetical protein
MAQFLAAVALLAGLTGATTRVALPALGAPPTKPKVSHAPHAPVLTCTLLTTEAPRGGRLEVEGEGFGQTPVVRVDGKVTRTIDRTEKTIAVQIPADSNGGAVSVTSGKQQAQCGVLTIIGRD